MRVPTPTFSLSRDSLRRMLLALVESELSRQRAGAELSPPPETWAEDLPLGKGGLEADSLEQVALAGRVNQMFHLHEVGTEDNLLRSRTLGEWVGVVEHARQRIADHFTFLTSGSQGVPKACPHEAALLEQEAATLAQRHADRARLVSLVPAHHIYGFLFSVLLPERLNIPVIPARHLGAGALARTLRAGDLIVAVPATWAYIARSLPHLPTGVHGVVSTGPCGTETTAALREAGLERLCEYYGSSETGGIGFRDEPAAPFTLHPFWQREGATALRRLRPAPLASAAPDTAQPMELIEPLDRLEWLDERRFRVVGRLDHAIKVGGVNVFPSRVEDVLRRAPGVAAAAIRVQPLDEGHRLKAFVVPAEPEAQLDSLRAELEEFIQHWLSPPERPRSLTFGPALPTNAMGKLADW
jgi:4-coumarate--CoA ligase (photoactive yellow protein activation family)